MAFNNTFPEFNYDDITWVQNNSIYGDELGFNEPSWDMSNVAGPSQPYTGVDVLGDFNNYPDFPSPPTAPTSLYPTHGVPLHEGYYPPFYQGTATPPFPRQPTAAAVPSPTSIHPAPSPVPTLSYGSYSLSPELYGAPTTPARISYTPAPVIPYPDDLGYDFFTGAGSSSLPVVQYPPANAPSYEESGHQFPQPVPMYHNAPAFDPTVGAAPPDIPLPAPVASSSGPKRTKQAAREVRRYNPLKTAERTASKKEGWDQSLPRFRARLHGTLFSVQDGQPSGGLVPAMALATIDQLVKEDLEQSPLRDTAAGKGTRSRNVEDYLKGLLGSIRRVESPSTRDAGESDEDYTSVPALSRLAGELEAKLAAVNQRPALRRSVPASAPKRGKAGEQGKGEAEEGKSEKRAKKSKAERAKRDEERVHLERMCSLFKAPRKGWTKREVLSLVVLFRLYGPDAFPRDFIKVRPTTSGP